ncbi:MAG: TolC family protein [Thermodesulfobacteriota bacterium]|nr:TolC family protein [Thermodesulfobacteriota bacterium]
MQSKYLYFTGLILSVFSLSVGHSWASPLTLDLNESISLALQNNHQIMISGEDRKIADEQIGEARSAALPEVKATGEYKRIDEPSTFGESIIGRRDNFAVNLGLEQPLYTGGQVWSALKIANLYKAYSDLGSKMSENQVIFSTKKGYYTVLFLKELVKIRGESVKLLKEHLEITKKKYRAELASHFEVLRAEVELANANPDLIRATNELSVAKDTFKKLLGLDLTTEITLKGSLYYAHDEMISLEYALKISEKERPDLGQQRLVKEISRENITIKKSGYRPKFSLFADYWGISPQFGSSELDWDWGWDAGIRAEIPIFSGFAVRSQVSQSRIEKRKTEIGYKDLKENIQLEIRTALNNIEEARQRIQSQEKNVEQAKEGLRIAEIRYKNEVSPQIEVMDAQVALAAARVNYFQAIYDYKVTYAQLELAIGGDLTDVREK